MDENTIYFTNERKYLDFYMVKQNATIDLIKSKGGLEDGIVVKITSYSCRRSGLPNYLQLSRHLTFFSDLCGYQNANGAKTTYVSKFLTLKEKRF